MNRISTQQRKLVSLVLIILLLLPIVYLGAPSDGTSGDSGGLISQLRHQHDLGETSLGDVDPTSSTMNLVLLGLRGIASNLLWQQALEQKSHKDWAGLRSTVDSIVLLQPHFEAVWKFQAWNLSYNVAAEWDGVEDRYHWVKEGGKFCIKGAKRNQKFPELFHDCGHILGHKIGQADEKKYFRKFFLDDPEIEGGGPDSELNPNAKDNYLVAKFWYQKSIDIEDEPGSRRAKRLARVLFRSYPARAQIEYASARGDEGLFDEVTQEAWEVAYDDVTKVWGADRFQGPPGCGLVVLEVSDDSVLENLIKEEGGRYSLEAKKVGVVQRQNMSHYRHWRRHCQVEKKPETVEAHRNLFKGKRAYLDRGAFVEAAPMLHKGLVAMEKILAEYPELEEQEDFREECLKGIILWKAALSANSEEVPAIFPLKYLWDSYPQEAAEHNELFNSLFSS